MTEEIERIREAFEWAEAIVIGAGAGLSAAAGLCYDGPRFKEKFGDFIRRYGMKDMYTAGFYPFKTQEESGPTGAATSITTAMTNLRARRTWNSTIS